MELVEVFTIFIVLLFTVPIKGTKYESCGINSTLLPSIL